MDEMEVCIIDTLAYGGFTQLEIFEAGDCRESYRVERLVMVGHIAFLIKVP